MTSKSALSTIELQDRFASLPGAGCSMVEELEQALQSLGYNQAQAQRAVAAVATTPALDEATWLRKSLQYLASAAGGKG